MDFGEKIKEYVRLRNNFPSLTSDEKLQFENLQNNLKSVYSEVRLKTGIDQGIQYNFEGWIDKEYNQLIQIENSKPNKAMNNQKPPKTWLIPSILVAMFCCMPFGIVGIVNASKVESRFNAGDIEGANKASSNAKLWTIISLILGIVFIVIYIFLVIIGSVSGNL